MALALGQAGARVALSYYNNAARAEATLTEFRDAGVVCELFRGDVTDEQDVERMVAQNLGVPGPD